VIGVGNTDRGDDGAGLLVARRLKTLVPSTVAVIESANDGMRLIELWTNKDFVFVIDALDRDGEPGAIHRFDAAIAPLPIRSFGASTHSFGVAEGIELARRLGRLPKRLTVYGIAGKHFERGALPSPGVQSAVAYVAQAIAQELCC
jgi:hydrogenase maturation protease